MFGIGVVVEFDAHGGGFQNDADILKNSVFVVHQKYGVEVVLDSLVATLEEVVGIVEEVYEHGVVLFKLLLQQSWYQLGWSVFYQDILLFL